ncbi:MAG: DsbA family protein [Acholeplasmataceae bacterium]
MKIEIWFDYLCPLSYQTHKNLEFVLENYHFDDLEVIYRSYEVIPKFSKHEPCTMHDVVSKHHVLTAEEAKELLKEIAGIDQVTPVSVHDAHRLSHLAKHQDRAYAFNKRVFKAFYEEHMDISDEQLLRALALEAGLDEEEVDDVLESTRYHHAVECNRENAILKGIHEIPHMRINGQIRLSGLQTIKDLITCFNRALYIENPSEYCEGDNCMRKKTR